MKSMNRNKRPFWYALFREKQRLEDGSYRMIYEEAVPMRAPISAGTGDSSVEQFGKDIRYDRVIVVDDVNCPIDENTILFIDTEPTKNADGDYVFDYIVKRVARSLNTVAIAVSRVNVS